MRLYISWIACVLFAPAAVHAQAPSPVDFARDVQPLLRERCYSCHGPSQQLQGLRLDRRRVAMPNRVGANRASIVPGNSAASPLYLKLIGKSGLQMPPDGPLAAEQIDVVKRWIDAGADWPDALAGEAAPTVPDQRAVDLMNALRQGDRRRFASRLRENSGLANAKGTGGSTPLMYAVLYGDAALVTRLLEAGADPNVRNDTGTTALMLAVDDAAKTRTLLAHGANPNAQSDDGQTPLLIASARPGAGPVVTLLLDAGANPTIRTSRGGTPLVLAASTGDADLITVLLARGVANKLLPLGQAVRTRCGPCVDALMTHADKADISDALEQATAADDLEGLRKLLARGATPGPEVLPSLALSPALFPDEVVQTLITRGADIHARTRAGRVVDLAKRQGDTSLVHLLVKAGATEDTALVAPTHTPRRASSVRAAIERSLPLLDRADVAFIQKAGCVSCHNNTLSPMTRAAARTAGIPVNESIAGSQLQAMADIMRANRERALQAIGVPGGSDTAGYLLLGLAAADYPSDETTDAWARYLKNLQYADGRWRILGQRPPIESSDIQATAAAARALDVYAPPAHKDDYRSAVVRAARWLETAEPKTTEDRAFKMLGLLWTGGARREIERVARELLSQQRSDGGWGQLSTLPSDAYATGQALVALRASRLDVTASAYQRGVAFLMNSQLEDGSWYVRTRTLPIQPYFDSDFPHGLDQFISTAATHWATMALAPAAR